MTLAQLIPATWQPSKRCAACQVALATHRVVRVKQGRREARPSETPQLCRACARATATAITADLVRGGVIPARW